MTTIYSSKLRDFNKKTFQVKDVYAPYRAGGIETASGFKFRTFYDLPEDEREVVFTGDEKIKASPNASKRELREKIWNKNERVFEFHKVKDRQDREFFKTYKKVFDVKVVFEQPVTVTNWKGEEQTGNEVVLQQVGASKIKSMLQVVAEVEPRLVDGKDKTGKPAKVPAFDWEDGEKYKLKDLFVKIMVSGEGMDTKYVFTPGKEFKVADEIDVNDLPF